MTLCSLSAPLRGRLASFPVLRLPVYQEVDLPLVWLVQDCEFRRSRVERGALCGWSLSVDGALRGGACVSLLPPARLVIRMSRSVYDACGLDARRESGGARGDAPMYTCDVDLRALGGARATRLAACFTRTLSTARMRLSWVDTAHDDAGGDACNQCAVLGHPVLGRGAGSVRELEEGLVLPALGPARCAVGPVDVPRPRRWTNV